MAATEVKRRRGTAEQNNAFTGAEGEITVDMTNQTLRVHDGVTVGGTAMAKNSDVESLAEKVAVLEEKITGIGIQAGTFIIGAGGTVVGALLCDGARPLISDYNELFEKIRHKWGTDVFYAHNCLVGGVSKTLFTTTETPTNPYVIYDIIDGALVPFDSTTSTGAWAHVWGNTSDITISAAAPELNVNSDAKTWFAWGSGVNSFDEGIYTVNENPQVGAAVYQYNGITKKFEQYSTITAVSDDGTTITINGAPYSRLEIIDFITEDGERFSLPDAHNRTFWGTLSVGYLDEQLPNIKGRLPGYTVWATAVSGTGPFYAEGMADNNGAGYIGRQQFLTYFDASKTNVAYQDNGQVRPNSIGVQVYIKY